MQDGSVRKTVMGALMGLLGLVALYMAAHAQDGGIYTGGLLIFVLAVAFIFALVKRHMDEIEPGHGSDKSPGGA